MKMIFLIYFFLEVIVTITLGGQIGGLNTFFEIVMTAVIGTVILMNLRTIFMQSLSALMSGQSTPQELLKGSFLTILGAVFLILPGFISDFIGILFQFSFMKTLLKKRVKPNFTNNQSYTNKGDDDVIDVEVIEHSSTLK